MSRVGRGIIREPRLLLQVGSQRSDLLLRIARRGSLPVRIVQPRPDLVLVFQQGRLGTLLRLDGVGQATTLPTIQAGLDDRAREVRGRNRRKAIYTDLFVGDGGLNALDDAVDGEGGRQRVGGQRAQDVVGGDLRQRVLDDAGPVGGVDGADVRHCRRRWAESVPPPRLCDARAGGGRRPPIASPAATGRAVSAASLPTGPKTKMSRHRRNGVCTSRRGMVPGTFLNPDTGCPACTARAPLRTA